MDEIDAIGGRRFSEGKRKMFFILQGQVRIEKSKEP
jgi:hypothetical protein